MGEREVSSVERCSLPGQRAQKIPQCHRTPSRRAKELIHEEGEVALKKFSGSLLLKLGKILII